MITSEKIILGRGKGGKIAKSIIVWLHGEYEGVGLVNGMRFRSKLGEENALLGLGKWRLSGTT